VQVAQWCQIQAGDMTQIEVGDLINSVDGWCVTVRGLCQCVCVSVYVSVCMCQCVCVSVYVSVCMCQCVCVSAYVSVCV